MGAPPARYLKASGGYDIATFTAGDGPTLIRTPVLWNHVSRQWTPEIWGPVFDALTRMFRLVLYDGRGQGLSTRGLPESHAFEDYLSDLEAVIERSGPGPVILSGWSFAASVAIRYAADHPERVCALILLEYVDFHARTDAMTRLAKEDWTYFVEATARTSWAGYDPELVIPVLYDAMSQQDMVRQAQAIRSVSGEAMLHRVRTPTLLIAHRAGSRPGAAEQSATRWAATIPGARLVLIDGLAMFGRVRDGVPEVVSAMADFANAIDAHSGAHEGTGAVRHLTGLSGRELDVIRLLAAGRSNAQIAEALVITQSTVAKHVTSILAKTESVNRTEAAVYAKEHGIA